MNMAGIMIVMVIGACVVVLPMAIAVWGAWHD